MASSGRQCLRSPMRRRRQAIWDELRIPDCASSGRDSDTVRFQLQPDRSLYLHIALDQCGGSQQSYLTAELNWTVPDIAARISAAPSRPMRGDCLSDTERHSLHRRPACVDDPVASVRPSERSASAHVRCSCPFVRRREDAMSRGGHRCCHWTAQWRHHVAWRDHGRSQGRARCPAWLRRGALRARKRG